MKIVRNKRSKQLHKVSNAEAKEMIKLGLFSHSTKGAYKSQQKDVRKFQSRSKREDNPQGTKAKMHNLEMMSTWHHSIDKQGKVTLIKPIVSHARNQQLQAQLRNRQKRA